MAAHPVASRKIVFALAFAAAVETLPRPVGAQNASNSAAAQGLFDSGRELMKKGNYAEACPKLEESQRLDPGSGTLLNLAVCYEKRGLTASAWTTYLEAETAARTAGKSDRVKSAQEHAAALAPRLARLTIRVAFDKVAGLEVKRDDVVVRPAQLGTAIPIDPGSHILSAAAPGHSPWNVNITMRAAESRTVDIPELKASSPSADAKPAAHPAAKTTGPIVAVGSTEDGDAGPNPGGSQRSVALVVGGFGVAGLAVGSIFGLMSMSSHDEASAYCNGGACTDQRGVDALTKARSYGNVSTAGFVVGVAGVAAGTILWFTAPRNVQVGVGMGTLQVAGAW